MRLKDFFEKKTVLPEDPAEVKEIVKRNLIDANRILRGLGVRCWLTDGSLLGYYREGDLLNHDPDADLGIMIEDYTDKIIPAFKEEGWQIKFVFGAVNCGLELAFSRDGVNVDLFFYYPDDERRWSPAWNWVKQKKRRNLIKYYFDAFDLKEVDFLGEKFLIPADPEKFVATKYGPGWKTPQKNWDWAFGPANAVATDIYIKKNKKKKVYDRIESII